MIERSRAALKISLIGSPEVRWDESHLPISRRQTRSLLYRLATRLVPVPRAQLCYLFWPDLPEANARRNLTHVLTLVRRGLPQPHLLVADDQTVALEPGAVWSDTEAFVQLIQTGDARQRPAALRKALDLCRGPFLEGFALPNCPEFENWLDQERAVWERRVDDALAAIVESQTAARDYPGAIAATRHALERNPLAEEMHRRLITLYAAIGNRSAALRQFEDCCAVLKQELGVAPLLETQAIYDAVREGRSPLPAVPEENVPATIQTSEPTPGPHPAPTEHAQAKTFTGTIPILPSPLIGRAALIADLVAFLGKPETRLITLVGPGGTGKTRMALAAADALETKFTDGAVFVPLAPLRDSALVPQAIADALGLGERDDQTPLERIQASLRQRELLLVLDNFEHIIDAAPIVAILLRGTLRLKILVTSRTLLKVSGEQAYSVPPLALPDPIHIPPPDELAKVGAVALFLARVCERVPGFALNETNAADIAAICTRLDGLPLAIELAAARAALLSPRMLLARLDQRLQLLTIGARDLPERQRTLRATIDWSFALLDPGEQLLFGRLAVFARGWTLAAAEAVVEAVGPLAISVLDGLQALVDKHLVLYAPGSDGEPRFSMLETFREYALERLHERGELAPAQAAHAEFFCNLVKQAEPLLHGPQQIEWFERLEEEHPNLRATLTWLLGASDPSHALRMALGLHHFWQVRSHIGEGLGWLNQAMEMASGQSNPEHNLQSDPILIAEGRLYTAQFKIMRGELSAAEAQLTELTAELRTRVAAPNATDTEHRILVRTLERLLQSQGMQNHAIQESDIDQLLKLAEALNDQRIFGETAFHQGRGMLYGLGRTDLARPMVTRAAAIFRQLGDFWPLALVTADLGILAMLDGDLEEARRRFNDSYASTVALRDRYHEAEVLNNLGEVARMAGEDLTAETHYEAALQLYRRLGTRAEAPRPEHNLGYLALHRGDNDLARSRFRASLAGFEAVGQPRGQIEAIAGLAAVAAAHTTPAHARLAARLWGAADTHHALNGNTPWPVDQAERVRYEGLARDTLGSPAFDITYNDGTHLTLADAIAEALSV